MTSPQQLAIDLKINSFDARTEVGVTPGGSRLNFDPHVIRARLRDPFAKRHFFLSIAKD